MTLLYTIEDQSENDSMELRKSLLEDEWVVFNTVTNRPHSIHLFRLSLGLQTVNRIGHISVRTQRPKILYAIF